MTTQTAADLPPDAHLTARQQSVGALTSAYLPLIKHVYGFRLHACILVTNHERNVYLINRVIHGHN
jgi:hypothetical protein